jgi:hypothetical protein
MREMPRAICTGGATEAGRNVPASLYAPTTVRGFFAAYLALITIDAPAGN